MKNTIVSDIKKHIFPEKIINTEEPYESCSIKVINNGIEISFKTKDGATTHTQLSDSAIAAIINHVHGKPDSIALEVGTRELSVVLKLLKEVDDLKAIKEEASKKATEAISELTTLLNEKHKELELQQNKLNETLRTLKLENEKLNKIISNSAIEEKFHKEASRREKEASVLYLTSLAIIAIIITSCIPTTIKLLKKGEEYSTNISTLNKDTVNSNKDTIELSQKMNLIKQSLQQELLIIFAIKLSTIIPLSALAIYFGKREKHAKSLATRYHRISMIMHTLKPFTRELDKETQHTLHVNIANEAFSLSDLNPPPKNGSTNDTIKIIKSIKSLNKTTSNKNHENK